MGAAARRHHCGVAGHQPHVVRRDAEPVGEHLGEARLVALAARLGARHRLDRAVGAHADFDMLVGLADRELDVIGNADAGEQAALAGGAPARRKARPVRELQHRIHVGAEISAVIDKPGGGAVGKLRAADQVAPPQRDAVDAEAARRDVD